MNPESSLPPDEDKPDENKLRPHTYDGIEEYDKKLPNWWLFTLHGAIIFAIGYWTYYHWTEHMEPGWIRVQSQIEAIKLAALNTGEPPSNMQLWNFSKDPKIVASGEKTFMTTCAPCHGVDLKGGIGQNLTDATWIHGGTPMEIFATVRAGVPDKGMPTWGPVLGQQRMAEVVAFIISKNSTIEKPAEETQNKPPNGT